MYFLDGMSIWSAAIHRTTQVALMLALSAVGLHSVRAYAGAATYAPRVRSSAAEQRSCRAPASHKLLVHTSTVIVWKLARPSRESPDGEIPATETYYGCVPPDGPKRVIVRAQTWLEEASRITRLISAGSFVAATKATGGKYGSGETLTIRNVRSGGAFQIMVSNEASDYEGGGGEQQLPEARKARETDRCGSRRMCVGRQRRCGLGRQDGAVLRTAAAVRALPP